MKNINKKVAINKVIVWLQKCNMKEYRQNTLIKEYLSVNLLYLKICKIK